MSILPNEKSDEELLRAYRDGNSFCRDILCQRYFRFRRQHARCCNPDSYSILDDWELNECFFLAYLSAEEHFQFTSGTFQAYFRSIFRNEIARAAGAKKLEFSQFHYLSLDETGEDGLLCDIVSEPSSMEDPAVFYTYAETLRELSMLPPKINPVTIDLIEVMREGYSLEEAAQILGLSLRNARELQRRYRKWARETLETAMLAKKE